MTVRAALLATCLLASAGAARASGVDAATQQLIVGIAPDWNTDHGTLQLYERTPAARGIR